MSANALLLCLPIALLTLGCIFYPNNFHVVSFFTTTFNYTLSNTNDTTKVPPPAADAKLNILFGILTMPQLNEQRRHLLRSVYAIQMHNLTTAKVDVRFVFCNSIQGEDKMFLALEIMLYGDIVILDCIENLNNGKTYAYFSSLPSMFSTGHDRPYDYVVKADDDAYFRLDALSLFLKDKPREDLYYGDEL